MSPAARTFVFVSGVVLATALLVVGGFFVILQARDQTRDNYAKIDHVEEIAKDVRRLSRDNATVLRIVLAVTGCTEADTPAQCQDKLRARSTAEGISRILEVDCRTREALAGKPPTPPDELCHR